MVFTADVSRVKFSEAGALLAVPAPVVVVVTLIVTPAMASVTRLLAPILVFTADEAWEFAGRAGSVHLETFPEPDAAWRDEALEKQVEEWLKLRGVVYQQAIEPARQAKTIAKPLEARITLQVPADQIARLEEAKNELEEFFIVSEVHFVPGPEVAASLAKSPHAGCARCW